jgi:hypothetical protein
MDPKNIKIFKSLRISHKLGTNDWKWVNRDNWVVEINGECFYGCLTKADAKRISGIN